uniref:Uncharacterized protein n=1 Tax=Glossina pallidipes TaxID=7398 RepID=A0A1A9ZRN5_GLOPL
MTVGSADNKAKFNGFNKRRHNVIVWTTHKTLDHKYKTNSKLRGKRLFVKNPERQARSIIIAVIDSIGILILYHRHGSLRTAMLRSEFGRSFGAIYIFNIIDVIDVYDFN